MHATVFCCYCIFSALGANGFMLLFFLTLLCFYYYFYLYASVMVFIQGRHDVFFFFLFFRFLSRSESEKCNLWNEWNESHHKTYTFVFGGTGSMICRWYGGYGEFAATASLFFRRRYMWWQGNWIFIILWQCFLRSHMKIGYNWKYLINFIFLSKRQICIYDF